MDAHAGLNPLADLAPPALALAGVRADPSLQAGGPRAAIDAAARLGYRAVTLDGATPGLRPRDLDRSARRDLAATLRRLELAFAGLDLWIPPEHFASREHADRAAGATTGAIALVADLARDAAGEAVLSVTLPRGLEGEPLELFRSLLASIVDEADRAGVALADHSLPLGEASASLDADAPLGIGIDPAALLLRGEDPVRQAGALSARVRCARWTDADALSRVAPAAPPKGRLDLDGYAATLAATGSVRRLVVDVRGLPDPLASAAALARTLP